MKLDEILSLAGKHKRAVRVGRGRGSGRGKTSSRGQKGGGARAGWKARYGGEGGQNPILKRIPKRGFNNKNFRVAYQAMNVEALEAFNDGDRVDIEALVTRKILHGAKMPVKILGNGKLSKKLTVVAHAFSASAEEKIRAAGGSTERISV
jgi:large subunit ribosomal protein L15